MIRNVPGGYGAADAAIETAKDRRRWRQKPVEMRSENDLLRAHEDSSLEPSLQVAQHSRTRQARAARRTTATSQPCASAARARARSIDAQQLGERDAEPGDQDDADHHAVGLEARARDAIR